VFFAVDLDEHSTTVARRPEDFALQEARKIANLELHLS
jgi:hypothetical protein